MTYDEFKTKLQDRIVTDRDRSFTCKCPGHDDDKASLSVSMGEDGRILVKCFAGCKLENILSPIGLKLRDLFPSNGNGSNGIKPQNTPSKPDRVVATYDYRDENNKVVFQVQRRESKSFIQRRPDGNGGWIYNMNGVNRVLYRLPEILSSEKSTWILIPEGEKDVDNVRKHGYVATTNAGGASQPWLDSYSEALRGRKVCVLPDNDDPGRKHANDVGSHLMGVAADVRVLMLPNLPEKGDVSNWLEAGNDPSTLLAMVEAAPVFSKNSNHRTISPDQSISLLTREIIGADVPTMDEIQDFLDSQEPEPILSLGEIKTAVASKVEELSAAINDDQKDALKKEVISLIAQCNDVITLDGWGEKMPTKLGIKKRSYNELLREERAAIDEKQAESKAKAQSIRQSMIATKVDQLKQNSAPHPYVIHEGMIQLFKIALDKESGEEIEKYEPVCTFTAHIVGEIRDEFDNITYKIEGVAVRGGAFTAEIDTETFGSSGKLRTALEAAAGALDTVFAKMEMHLGPAIKLLSEGLTVQRLHRYDRTGWIDGTFYLPGRTPEGVTVELPKSLPYCNTPITDEAGAVDAIGLLMQAMKPEYSPIVFSAVIAPPLASLAGLSNHRFGFMLKGQTGTYKTGQIMAFMSMWGEGFLDKKNLIRWGTGTTANAAMVVATGAYHLPFFLDNYKANTGDGESGFVSLMHTMLEGREKLRQHGKTGKLRQERDIEAWPICTGEDMPQSDPATVARFLVVPAVKNENGIPDGIKWGGSVTRLAQVGPMWLNWLESDAGKQASDKLAANFDTAQIEWRKYLLGCNKGMPNVDRVASTLALNEACFYAATLHPVFGHVLSPYLVHHKNGLRSIAEQMSGATTDGLEAYRFVNAIREMLSTGRAILVKSQMHQDEMVNADKENIIGWADGDGGAYLYPGTARKMVERDMNVKLSGMSDASIGNQLMELGWLGSFDKGRSLKSKWINGSSIKMLHISKRGLIMSEPGDNQAVDTITTNDEDEEIL